MYILKENKCFKSSYTVSELEEAQSEYEGRASECRTGTGLSILHLRLLKVVSICKGGGGKSKGCGVAKGGKSAVSTAQPVHVG